LSETNADDLASIQQRLHQLRDQIGRVVLGQDQVLEQMIITLMCGGHALVEGVPGTAKTLAVRALAMSLSCRTKRIQFTPDLMPSDIVGTNTFNLATNQFELHKGPLFTDLLLADEINRAPAKTQSALLESMSERHATIDGVRHEVSPVFTVFATQNPIEFEGTYPLPEAQQDRFLMKIPVGYPGIEAETAVLEAVDRGDPPDRLAAGSLEPIIDRDGLIAAKNALARVRVEAEVLQYVLKVVRETREHESILVGAGPRGSIYLLLSSKARALLQGRDYVTPDDVVAMLHPVLGHRMTLTADAEVSGVTADEVVQSIVEHTDVPR
jgi:MoxR-like ATPase